MRCRTFRHGRVKPDQRYEAVQMEELANVVVVLVDDGRKLSQATDQLSAWKKRG